MPALTTSCVLTLLLSACSGTSAPETAATLNAPATPAESVSPSAVPPPEVPQELNEAQPSDPSAPTEPTGSPKSLMEDCVVVAAGVSSVLLAPLSFIGEDDQQTMARLEEQLHSLEEKVPAELQPHFAHIADAAEGGAPGAGHFDEPAFRAALEPVQLWLQDHCNEPAQ